MEANNVYQYPLARKQLLGILGISSYKMLKVWLEEIGIRHQRVLSRKEVRDLIQHVGMPEGVVIEGL